VIGDQLQLEQARQAEEARLQDQETRDRERERLGSLAEAIRQQLDADDPRAAAADALAASGDQRGMATLLGEISEEKKRRELAQRLGVDPDDPEAIETAQRIRQEEELRKRGLGSYYRQPERPREGATFVGEDGYYYLGDQVAGTARLFRDQNGRPIRAPARDGSPVSREEKEHAEDFNKAVTLAGQKRHQQNVQYQARLRDQSQWPWEGERQVPPPPPADNFQEMVQNHFTVLQRAREATRRPKLVSPVEGHDPSGAPTGPTGPGKGRPQQQKATADDVIRLLPKGMVLDPGARAAIEADLAAGKTPAQIRAEILKDNGLL
jgi:hypothetical protein